MAYATSNPPQLVSQGLGGSGVSIWTYSSTADASADADTSGFFSNGYDLGMRAGDLVIANLSGLVTSHVVMSASSTGVDLGSGSTAGSTTNSD